MSTWRRPQGIHDRTKLSCQAPNPDCEICSKEGKTKCARPWNCIVKSTKNFAWMQVAKSSKTSDWTECSVNYNARYTSWLWLSPIQTTGTPEIYSLCIKRTLFVSMNRVDCGLQSWSWTKLINHDHTCWLIQIVVTTDETVFTSETEMFLSEKTVWFLCKPTCPSYV